MGGNWGIQEPPSPLLAFIWGIEAGEETTEAWRPAQVSTLWASLDLARDGGYSVVTHVPTEMRTSV